MALLSRYALAVIFVLATSSTAIAQVDDVLKAHFQAIGGLDRLSEITTVKRLGTSTLSGFLGSFEGSTEEIAVIGKQAYTKNELGPILSNTTVVNNSTGWKNTVTEGLVNLEGPELELQKALFMYLSPLHAVYDLYGKSAFVMGADKTIDGKDSVTLILGGGASPVSLHIDKVSHHLIAVGLTTVDPAMGEINIVIGYGDYTEHAGVMLPNTTSLNVANGMIATKTTYQNTEINIEVDEAIFEKP